MTLKLQCDNVEAKIPGIDSLSDPDARCALDLGSFESVPSRMRKGLNRPEPEVPLARARTTENGTGTVAEAVSRVVESKNTWAPKVHSTTHSPPIPRHDPMAPFRKVKQHTVLKSSISSETLMSIKRNENVQ